MKEQVLTMLTQANGAFLSGEAMSSQLGISRAAVWKAIDSLRQEGYEIDSVTRRGYRLLSGPDRLTAGSILPWLQSEQVKERLICLPSVDSTNNYAKKMALEGLADGATIVADEQTGGRGRLGRTFQSPKGKGIYFTCFWRPDVTPAQAVNLTSYVAVALCDGIEEATGLRPGIKWTNDIVLGGKKLCGILTEMAVEGESGALQYLICGIGVNANHEPEDFSPDVAEIATSLSQELGHPVHRGKLFAAIRNAIEEMHGCWLTGTGGYWQRYRDNCLTIGKEVKLLRRGGEELAFAEDIDPDFGLIVRHPDGRKEIVNAGEVSVRGLYGYL